jgi:hypothetical protein
LVGSLLQEPARLEIWELPKSNRHLYSNLAFFIGLLDNS